MIKYTKRATVYGVWKYEGIGWEGRSVYYLWVGRVSVGSVHDDGGVWSWAQMNTVLFSTGYETKEAAMEAYEMFLNQSTTEGKRQ